MTKISSILTTLLVIVSSISLSAQEEWSLQKCIDFAVKNSFNVAQADMSIKDAGIVTSLSEQQRYPSVSANTNIGWNFGRSIDPTSNGFVNTTFFSNRYGVNTDVLLYNGGRLKNTIKQNRIKEGIAKENKNATINDLIANVAQGYFRALLAQDRYESVQIQLRSIDNQIEQMNKLVNAGSRARFEIYDLEAQKATVEQDITSSQNAIDIEMLNLKGLMNLPADYDIALIKPEIDEEVRTNLELTTIDEVYERALRTRPNAKSLDLEVASAEGDIQIAKSQYYPSLSFGGNLSTNYSNQAREQTGGESRDVSANVLINDVPSTITTSQFVPTFRNTPFSSQLDGNFGYGFGFSARVPIYSQGSTKGNVQRANLALENARIRKEQYNVQLRTEMMRYLTDARAAKRSYEAAEKTLKAREVSFENAEKRYELGAINTYEYVSIQDQVATARNNYLLARYDYLLKAKLLDFYQGYPLSAQ